MKGWNIIIEKLVVATNITENMNITVVWNVTYSRIATRLHPVTFKKTVILLIAYSALYIVGV